MKYEPKPGDQLSRFNQAMDKILSVPYEKVKQELKKEQIKRVAKKKRLKSTESASSRDSA
jgi:hypothetical protein